VTFRINPNFTPKLTIPTLLCDVVRIVDNFSISHDTYYHGWFPGIFAQRANQISAIAAFQQLPMAGRQAAMGSKVIYLAHHHQH